MRDSSNNHSLPDTTSTSLIRRVRSFDEHSWDQLVCIYGPLVYTTCRCRGLSDHDSADLVQTVFIKVFSSIHKFRREDAGDTFRGWLRTMTRNLIIDHVRARESRPEARGGTTGLQRIMALESESHSTSSDLRDNDLESPRDGLPHLCLAAMDVVRSEFEPRVWDAFTRTAVHGDRASDVARDLEISNSAVYQSKTRVLNRLRQLLADE